MILISHGAFDHRDDRSNGVSRLADQIRQMGLSNHIFEIECDENVEIDNLSLTLEQNLYIGYSNGGEQVETIHQQVMLREQDPELTSVLGHMILLDYVHKGIVRQTFMRFDLQLPTSIKSCLCFYRTEGTLMYPFHNLIAKDDGVLFQNIPIEAQHGNLPKQQTVVEMVLKRTRDIFTGAL